ncbi:MAG: ribulose-phosphate 3-epimerase [Candidatus Omnitrophica bacterium]|jgi:ribulose-phosphate 3-epimerase|nr:ribulose-phosphate 3-epimerase [Candidatus Omnitrophota bacterium]
MRKIKIAPSILSADFSRLADELKKVEAAGADLVHVDIMDGHFVPNITIGPQVVKSLRKVTKLPLDVHLMIERPVFFLKSFMEAGSDMITVHIETVSASGIKKISRILRANNIKCGVSLNPATPLKRIKPILGFVDSVLVMSVNPGFGGQAFIAQAVPKIAALREIFDQDIAVDGGINEQTAKLVIQAGANILAAGSYIFNAADTKQAIERIRNAG